MESPKHRSTAPPSPTQKKSLNFFKRHLGTRRRSSVSLPNGHPISPQAPAQPHTPRSTARKASVSSVNHDLESTTTSTTDATDATDASTFSPEVAATPPSSSAGQSPPQDSKAGGIKWATGFTDGTAREVRASSAVSVSTARRGSIYVRGAEGSYVEGVDAGAGSKARRLSVHIPDNLQTDECPLGDHFSIFSRAGKKDIGEGGAAVVRLMQSKTAGNGKEKEKLFAVKEFRELDSEEETEADYVRKIKSEYAIAKSCQHPNIVQTYRLCYSDKKWFHVMEYCELGDLNDIVNKGYFSRDDRNCMFKQLLRGVDYLHSCGIAHRDLKSENLIISKDGCLKIADFGTAEVFSGTHPGLERCRPNNLIDEQAEVKFCTPGIVGSRPYMAPEIIKHEADYDPRSVDIWSCAIVYISMCVGGTPWDSASLDVKNYNIYCGTWDEWLERYPDGIIKEGRPLPKFVGSKQFAQLDDLETKRIVMGMLHPDPAKRWSAHDVLETVTVTEYPCCQQEGYSNDIKTRQRKAMHNHAPPKAQKGHRFLKP